MVEEAPLCRFRRIEIIGRGDGISPNLVKNLHIVRRVGTLSAAQFKTTELKKRKSFLPAAKSLHVVRRVGTLF